MPICGAKKNYNLQKHLIKRVPYFHTCLYIMSNHSWWRLHIMFPLPPTDGVMKTKPPSSAENYEQGTHAHYSPFSCQAFIPLIFVPFLFLYSLLSFSSFLLPSILLFSVIFSLQKCLTLNTLNFIYFIKVIYAYNLKHQLGFLTVLEDGLRCWEQRWLL